MGPGHLPKWVEKVHSSTACQEEESGEELEVGISDTKLITEVLKAQLTILIATKAQQCGG